MVVVVVLVVHLKCPLSFLLEATPQGISVTRDKTAIVCSVDGQRLSVLPVALSSRMIVGTASIMVASSN